MLQIFESRVWELRLFLSFVHTDFITNKLKKIKSKCTKCERKRFLVTPGSPSCVPWPTAQIKDNRKKRRLAKRTHDRETLKTHHQRREQERFPGTINHRLVDCQVINHMFLEIAFLGSKILSPLGGWWVSSGVAVTAVFVILVSYVARAKNPPKGTPDMSYTPFLAPSSHPVL